MFDGFGSVLLNREQRQFHRPKRVFNRRYDISASNVVGVTALEKMTFRPTGSSYR
jgi:hypothetical protein